MCTASGAVSPLSKVVLWMEVAVDGVAVKWLSSTKIAEKYCEIRRNKCGAIE